MTISVYKLLIATRTQPIDWCEPGRSKDSLCWTVCRIVIKGHCLRFCSWLVSGYRVKVNQLVPTWRIRKTGRKSLWPYLRGDDWLALGFCCWSLLEAVFSEARGPEFGCSSASWLWPGATGDSSLLDCLTGKEWPSCSSLPTAVVSAGVWLLPWASGGVRGASGFAGGWGPFKWSDEFGAMTAEGSCKSAVFVATVRSSTELLWFISGVVVLIGLSPCCLGGRALLAEAEFCTSESKCMSLSPLTASLFCDNGDEAACSCACICGDLGCFCSSTRPRRAGVNPEDTIWALCHVRSHRLFPLESCTINTKLWGHCFIKLCGQSWLLCTTCWEGHQNRPTNNISLLHANTIVKFGV